MGGGSANQRPVNRYTKSKTDQCTASGGLEKTGKAPPNICDCCPQRSARNLYVAVSDVGAEPARISLPVRVTVIRAGPSFPAGMNGLQLTKETAMPLKLTSRRRPACASLI